LRAVDCHPVTGAGLGREGGREQWRRAVCGDGAGWGCIAVPTSALRAAILSSARAARAAEPFSLAVRRATSSARAAFSAWTCARGTAHDDGP